MLFKDVDEYYAYIVRCVERSEGLCTRSSLLYLAEYCAVAYERIRRVPVAGCDPSGMAVALAIDGTKSGGTSCGANVQDAVRRGCAVVQDVLGCTSVLHEIDDVESSCYSRGKKISGGNVVCESLEDEEKKDDKYVSGIKLTCKVDESKTERNRRWRLERKLLKKKRQAMQCDWRSNSSSSSVVSLGLKETLEEKWKSQNLLAAEKAKRELEVLKASSVEQEKEDVKELCSSKVSLGKKWEIENALAIEKARRQLEVLKATDLEQEVKQYRTKVSAATERNMVSIEKTHAKLRQTGNLPNEQGGGFAETIISGVPGFGGGSGTISPDSSASMAEFRACQKALLDAEKEIAEYKRKVKIASEKYGFPLEQVDFLDKEVWTDTQTNQDILDGIYPNGYGKDTSLFEDGKFRAIGV